MMILTIKGGGVAVVGVVIMMIFTHFVSLSALSIQQRHVHLSEVLIDGF